jgi:hypothetical protein
MLHVTSIACLLLQQYPVASVAGPVDYTVGYHSEFLSQPAPNWSKQIIFLRDSKEVKVIKRLSLFLAYAKMLL